MEVFMSGWKLLSLICFVICIFTMSWSIFWLFLIASGFFLLVDNIAGYDDDE